MKIVTIGISPYILSSNGKLHSKVLKRLLLDGHSVASLVWSHDTSFFFPEEHDGKKKFYYEFTVDGQNAKIPVFPFRRGDQESIVIYEALNQFQPDLIVTIGDVTDFIFMHAVKMFYTPKLQWFMIYTGRSLPIHEDYEDVVRDMDGVLCTNHLCQQEIQKIFSLPSCDMSHVGVDTSVFRTIDPIDNTHDKFRIMTYAKNMQVDNAPMLMEVVSRLRQKIPNIELYVHTNILDKGDYDLDRVKQRLDPGDEFIRFPRKCVSYVEGIPERDLVAELNAADVFVSAHMTAATSCGAWEALACGCYPLLSDCGSNRDIEEELIREGAIKKEGILLRCIELMTTGEASLNICDPIDMEKKILGVYRDIKKNKGDQSRFSVFTIKYDESQFLQKVSEMSVRISRVNNTLCVETA